MEHKNSQTKKPGDMPLPMCLVNRLSHRTQTLLRELAPTLDEFLRLKWREISVRNNVGFKTWREIEALQEELRPALKKAEAAGGAGYAGMFQIDRRAHAGFDAYFAAFLAFFPPIRGWEIIFEHRFGITGSAKPESLEESRFRFKPPVTRERVRQIADKIEAVCFGEDAWILAADLLADARAKLAANGGAVSLADFTAALEDAAGWARTPNPARLARFVRLFKAVDFYPKLQIITVRDFGKTGATAEIAERFKAFCMDKARAFSEIDYVNFKAVAPGVSYQAYQLMAFALLQEEKLPADKTRQLRAFATMGRLSFSDAGDARPVSAKVLDALRQARGPVTNTEWLRKARFMFPNDDIDIVQIRRMSQGVKEVVNYDRGKFIWHEYVSIPPDIARDAEKHFLAHLKKHGLEACSVHRYYTLRQGELAAAGVTSQTLFYFLLKSGSKGVLEYPEYPKVTRPGGDGGPGAFDRIFMAKLGADRNVSNAEFERFHAEVLEGDPRLTKWYHNKFRRNCVAALKAAAAIAPVEKNATEEGVTPSASARLAALADAALAECGIVCCPFFYEIHKEELRALGVESADRLAAALLRAKPGLHFSDNAFSTGPETRVADEIRRVLAAAKTMTVPALATALRYIPCAMIEAALAGDPAFLSNRSGRDWALADNVKITADDLEEAREFINENLQEADWIPAHELDITAIQKRNPGIPPEIIHAKIMRGLAPDFELQRGVIARGGAQLSARKALDTFCRSRDTMTREEFREMTKKVYGRSGIACLDVPAASMVRATPDLYVANRLVRFDKEKTDAALAALCPGDYIPIFAVKDFSTFPATTHPWTHTLLESYCRKHSSLFTFTSLGWSVNSAGVILRKSAAPKPYRAILTDALARAGIPPGNNTAVMQFLKREGYIASHAPAFLQEVLQDVKRMRARG